ncbi:MAG: hypothetical protein LC799_31145, partial [Actinobacteria bacterium]|nr:hypothetical protein [Actinomycetota bacterium]
FIPGWNLLAIGLLVVVGLSQGLLAASGNGSWADVGLTVFSLATLGLGRLATSALKGAQAATRAAGAGGARAAALRSSSAARTAAGRSLSRRGVSAAQRRGARKAIDAAKRDARREGSRAAREVREAPLATANPAQVIRSGGQVIRSGGKDAARFYNDIAGMRARFPTDSGVQNAARHADVLRNTNAGLASGNNAVDFSDKALEQRGVQGYRDAKGHFKKEVGSTW